MKKPLTALLIIAACLAAPKAQALGKTGIGAYGTYWNGSEEVGYGGGLKLTKSLLDILFLDGRASYISFDTEDVQLIPLEASINIGLPGFITPYAGIGAGYYFIDAADENNLSGYFGQIGVEVSVIKIGVLAELRYHDLEGKNYDDLSINLGLLYRF